MTETILARGIQVTKMAINSLDLDEGTARHATDLFPIISDNVTISEFFNKHFEDTRKGKHTKSCAFYDNDAALKTKLKRYKEDSNQSKEGFLELSKELTLLLLEVMKSSSSSSSGKFFVIELKDENEEEWLFLIKLDPNKAVQINNETLTLEVLEDILPETSDKVHKCAIIKFNMNPDEKAELFVLDRQQKEGEVAKFFVNSFLQAYELLNDSIITSKVIQETKLKLLSIAPEIDRNHLYREINSEFRNGQRINIQDSVTNIIDKVLPEDFEDRELFMEQKASEFVNGYLEKYKDHNASFIVARNDNTIIYKADKGQVHFKYNSGISDQVDVTTNLTGDTVITVSKELNLIQKL